MAHSGVMGIARRAGFGLIDVERLGPHYAITLPAWVECLEASADRAHQLVDEEVFRTWRLQRAPAQLVLAPPGAGRPAIRPLRPWRG